MQVYNERGELIWISSIRLCDGGTYCEFEAYYDDGREVDDCDYYWIQDEFALDLDYWARCS